MGGPLDDDGLSRRLAALADAVPAAPVADRRSAVRRRARAVRRRRTALGSASGLAVVAAVALVAPLPGADRAPAPLAGSPAPTSERVVRTFSFPDQGAVAELVGVPAEVAAGQRVEVTVRVRTERGRVGGVDLVWGDGANAYLSGVARCTPDAGPTTVELRAAHAFPRAGEFVVRARPQVLVGCRDGVGRFSTRDAEPARATVRVR